MFGYIDANSGSLILQLTVGGLFTVLLFFRQIIAWVKGLFSGSRKDDVRVARKG